MLAMMLCNEMRTKMNTTTAKQTRKRLGLTPAMRRALSGYKCSYAVVTHSVVYRALVRRGWIYAYSIITTAGRTQLHNVRAAMPGEWA